MMGFISFLVGYALLLCFLGEPTPVDGGGIVIEAAGTYPYKHTDIGLIMFVQLVNRFRHQLRVKIDVKECCELLYYNEASCYHISLMKSPLDYLPAGCSVNVTFLYPTMYPFNRRGACRMTVKYKRLDSLDYDIVNHKFYFNTYMDPEGLVKGSMRTMKTMCLTADLNPYDNCRPVDCQMKYLSARPFFSYTFQICLPSPDCFTKVCEKGTPDVVYEPLANVCEGISVSVSENEMKSLRSSDLELPCWDTRERTAEVSWDLRMAQKVIKCHHGYINSKTRICDCYLGWTSTPFPWEQYVPSNSFYHMCNVLLESSDRYFTNLFSFDFGILMRSGIITFIFVAMTIALLYCRLEPRRFYWPTETSFMALADVESYGSVSAKGSYKTPPSSGTLPECPTGSDLYMSETNTDTTATNTNTSETQITQTTGD